MTGSVWDRWAWGVLCCTVGLVVLLYLLISLAASHDPLLMPLDDTYIHFQYARQIAHGDPLVYNPGDPATSGGTSLLYPPLLAVGYLLGFGGWSLAYWALLLGVAAHLGASWLVYLIGRENPLTPTRHDGIALVLAVTYAVGGPFVWAALSGMETTLFIFLALLTLYAVQCDHFRLAIIAATLVTLTRPEGLVLGGGAVVWLALRRSWAVRSMHVGWLAAPLLAGLIQPALNLLATGSISSSGMQAKSHFGNLSVPWTERIWDSLKFFARIWGELISGGSADWGMFIPRLFSMAAIAALVIGLWLTWRDRRWRIEVLIAVWLLALSVGIASLDTAFWQFKRYQLPLLALLYPPGIWMLGAFGNLLTWGERLRWLKWFFTWLCLASGLLTMVKFADYYGENVRVVRDQQVPMARWVRDNLPPDARVGAHDVGLVRYFGERDLYDVVGLTTRDAAPAWRQGPGVIFEQMAHSDTLPGYFAIYPDVQGLSYLVDAGIFGEVLAEFPVDLPEHNVAAALDYQAVYRADWSDVRREERVAQTPTLEAIIGLRQVDSLDVANLANEESHDYEWWEDDQPDGFVSEVYRNAYHACGLADDECWAVDGGRILTGGEEFTLRTHPEQDLLLITRVHGRGTASLEITVNGDTVIQRVQPDVPGRWTEIVTWIPAEAITSRHTQVRIEATSGEYMPYYHWAYQGDYTPDLGASEQAPVAQFGAAVDLLNTRVTVQSDHATVALRWRGPAEGAGDGVLFVHMYNKANIDAEPVTQTVTRSAGGVLPPGNWLPGTFWDTVDVPLPTEPGEYVVAVGLFDAVTGQRFPVTGDSEAVQTDDDRLFIGDVTIAEESLHDN